MMHNLEDEISRPLGAAQRLINDKKYSDALAILSFLDTLEHPSSELHELISTAYSLKGLCCRMLSVMDKAVGNYEKALLFNKNSIAALTGLAEVYLDLTQYQKAKSVFERILSIESKNIPARKGLVQANRSLGLNVSDNSMLRDEINGLLSSAEEGIENDDVDLARKALFKILLRDPLHIDALNGLSVCDIMEWKIDYALEKISTILKIDSVNETATANLYYIKEQTRRAVNG